VLVDLVAIRVAELLVRELVLDRSGPSPGSDRVLADGGVVPRRPRTESSTGRR
jgi:hypothetical protein